MAPPQMHGCSRHVRCSSPFAGVVLSFSWPAPPPRQARGQTKSTRIVTDDAKRFRIAATPYRFACRMSTPIRRSAKGRSLRERDQFVVLTESLPTSDPCEFWPDGSNLIVSAGVQNRLGRGWFKTGHFESLKVRRTAFSAMVPEEAVDGESAQGGDGAFDSDASGARLVAAAHRSYVGHPPRDGGPVRAIGSAGGDRREGSARRRGRGSGRADGTPVCVSRCEGRPARRLTLRRSEKPLPTSAAPRPRSACRCRLEGRGA